MIKKIYMAQCGYCVNNIKHVFKNQKSKKMSFPANCFVFEHEQLGFIVYDTGYTHRIYEGGFPNKAYTSLNPTFVQKQDSLAYKLKSTNIRPEDINYVILSHMHPDHIGGLKDFPSAKIVVSNAVYETYKKGALKDLIFKNFIPHDFEKRIVILEKEYEAKTYNGQLVYDCFGQELLLTDLSGHTMGQVGLLLPKGKLLVAADAYWLKDEIFQDKQYTKVTKTIMADYNLYKKTHSKIKKILDSDPEMSVVSSHENIEHVEELGHVVKTYDTQILL